MGISGNFTGTPWHVDRFTREEDDPKRHRSRCIYFSKEDKYCSQYHMRCFGSAHCRYYREPAPNREKREEYSGAVKKSENGISDDEIQKLKFKENHPIGSRIQHKSFGTGVIKQYEDERVRIRFDSGKDTWLAIDVCVKNHLLI